MAAERCVVAGTLRASLDVSLLSPQAEFLASLAGGQPSDGSGAQDATLSAALSNIIDHFESTVPLEKPRPVKRVRKHFSVSNRYADFVNSLCIRWGVGRSEVVRRLIDHAIKSGFRSATPPGA